jgi:hypothetical protein
MIVCGIKSLWVSAYNLEGKSNFITNEIPQNMPEEYKVSTFCQSFSLILLGLRQVKSVYLDDANTVTNYALWCPLSLV